MLDMQKVLHYRGINPTQKILYMCLMELCTQGGTPPTVNDLCLLSGTSRGTVYNNLKVLEGIGAVKKELQFNQYNGQMPNKYTVYKLEGNKFTDEIIGIIGG